MESLPANAGVQIQATLDGLVHSVQGVAALLVSDAEGVVLLHAHGAVYQVTRVGFSRSLRGLTRSHLQENSIDVAQAAVFASAVAQASKLQYGDTKAIAAFHANRTLVFVNVSARGGGEGGSSRLVRVLTHALGDVQAKPLYVTVVAGKDCNVGALMHLAPQLVAALGTAALRACWCSTHLLASQSRCVPSNWRGQIEGNE